MSTARATFQIGRYVSLEVRQYGGKNVEVIFIQTLYVNNLLKKTEFPLTLQRWQQFIWQTKDIEEAVTQHRAEQEVHYVYHLGRNRYVQVNSGFPVVDLREFWMPEGKDQVQPTRRGIALKFDEYENLTKLRPEIENVIPELDNIQPCLMDTDHMNQEGYLRCGECNPNTFHNW